MAAKCNIFKEPVVLCSSRQTDSGWTLGRLPAFAAVSFCHFLDTMRHWRRFGRVVFVETSVFTRRIAGYMDDEEYGRLQSFLANRPAAGKVILHSGGVRKLRWPGSGRGKRGGLRVIYYWWAARDRISMLLIYAKSEQDDLTSDQLKQLRTQLAP